MPQLPQLDGSPAVLTSQPFDASVSQSAWPGLHDTMVQLDALHDGLAFGRLHALLQPPQLFGSLVVLTSQPSESIWLQSRYPPAHAETAQFEDAHTDVA